MGTTHFRRHPLAAPLVVLLVGGAVWALVGWGGTRGWWRGSAAEVTRGGAELEMGANPASRVVFHGALDVTETRAGSRLVAEDSKEQNTAFAGELGMPSPPTNPAELANFVGWMRSVPREDLLRLTNAEYKFKPSALVELLRGLDGPWVVPAMGDIAVGETDDLVRAALVRAVCTALCCGRLRDPAYGPLITRLLPIFAAELSDPFEVGGDIVSRLYEISLTQGVDYGAALMPLLETADNPDLLVHGFLLLGSGPEARELVVRSLVEHTSPEGRFGALEALRLGDGLSADELAQISLDAIAVEANPRNKVLLVEMLGSRGGAGGIEALHGMLLGGDDGLAALAAPMLALASSPDDALEMLDQAIDRLSVDLNTMDGAEAQHPKARREREAALWRAIAAVPGPEAMERLLDAARDSDQPAERRVMALSGLGMRELDATTIGELREWVQGDQPPELRAEALKWLALEGATASAGGSAAGDGVAGSNTAGLGDEDLRALAATDPAPEVRAQAVAMAALRPNADTRGWLEERLLTDRSPEVRAQALGALVMHAHYTGDGDGVLGHLQRARRLVADPELLALLDQGEEMVRGFDPRRLELELEREAAFYARVAPMMGGSAGHAAKRQAAMQAQWVAALRAGSQ